MGTDNKIKKFFHNHFFHKDLKYEILSKTELESDAILLFFNLLCLLQKLICYNSMKLTGIIEKLSKEKLETYPLINLQNPNENHRALELPK